MGRMVVVNRWMEVPIMNELAISVQAQRLRIYIACQAQPFALGRNFKPQIKNCGKKRSISELLYFCCRRQVPRKARFCASRV